MTNMDEFNQAVVTVLDKLSDAFPLRIDLDLDKLVAERDLCGRRLYFDSILFLQRRTSSTASRRYQSPTAAA